VHRDLKPENVFLASSRHAAVTYVAKIYGVLARTMIDAIRPAANVG
jgi:serine/threonine protein kinase